MWPAVGGLRGVVGRLVGVRPDPWVFFSAPLGSVLPGCLCGKTHTGVRRTWFVSPTSRWGFVGPLGALLGSVGCSSGGLQESFLVPGSPGGALCWLLRVPFWCLPGRQRVASVAFGCRWLTSPAFGALCWPLGLSCSVSSACQSSHCVFIISTVHVLHVLTACFVIFN